MKTKQTGRQIRLGAVLGLLAVGLLAPNGAPAWERRGHLERGWVSGVDRDRAWARDRDWAAGLDRDRAWARDRGWVAWERGWGRDWVHGPLPGYVTPAPVCADYWVPGYWNGPIWMDPHWERFCR